MGEAEKYINALTNGDNLIIKEIYSKIFPKVLSFILNNKGCESDAHDVFHDALMSIITTQSEEKQTILSFEAYLFVICKNIWKKNLKNRVIKIENPTLIQNDIDISELILEQKGFDFYLKKFDHLSDNCKELLSNYFNGVSYEDILSEYDYASINTVRQRIFKCRSKLIDLIKGDKEFQKLKEWGI